MVDFLWHKVSDKEKQEVKKQAKEIMDKFASRLEKVESKLREEPLIERVECEREEGRSKECDISFRKIMFENAPQKNKDFIIAEKKKW